MFKYENKHTYIHVTHQEYLLHLVHHDLFVLGVTPYSQKTAPQTLYSMDAIRVIGELR